MRRAPDRFIHLCGISATAPGIIGGDEIFNASRTHGSISEVVHRIDRPGSGAGTCGGQKLQPHHLDIPIHPGNANTISAHGANGAGHMRAMAIIVKWIIVIIDEIPPDQIIAIAIAILIGAIFPTPVIQQIASINAAIAVVIHHIGSIGRAVQIAESDQAVRVNIVQPRAYCCWDFALIEPDIQVKIRVGVINPGINHAYHTRHGTCVAIRPGFIGLAAIGILHRTGIAQHSPECTAGIAGIIARHGDVDCGVFHRGHGIRGHRKGYFGNNSLHRNHIA